jgi:23S rRNA pseudouridine2605 synthase
MKPINEVKIRLNKFIANSGYCSRRKADELIENGLVKVNGKVIKELGYVLENLELNITVEGKRITSANSGSQNPLYILMNKPTDVITTVNDEKGRKTVIDLLKPKVTSRVFPVGRLDRKTSGVLLLTNDGDLTYKLTHPSYNIPKEYKVVVNKNIELKDFEKLLSGIVIQDQVFKFDQINISPNDLCEAIVVLHSGKYHIVRLMFAELGYDVVKLDRLSFAGIKKGKLLRGEWRYLTPREIYLLKNKFIKSVKPGK